MVVRRRGVDHPLSGRLSCDLLVARDIASQSQSVPSHPLRFVWNPAVAAVSLTAAPRLRTGMADRIMRVNAFTTLDLIEAEAEGHGFTEEAYATLNVTSPRNDPDHVTLQLELDNTELETLAPHADSVTLSAEEARTLAAELEEHAGKVEDARD